MSRARHTQARRRDERTPPRWLPYLKMAALLALVVAPVGYALVQGGRWLVDPATFPVRSVKVEGEFRYLDRAALERTVSAHAGSGLLRLDVEAVRAEVEGLPWVARASVRRVWPDGLVVRVGEQQPLARWAGGGLVNTAGEVFAAQEGSGPQGLPEFAGPQGLSPLVTQRYREFAPLIQRDGFDVRRIELDDRNAWRVRLSTGLTLELGRDDVTRRLVRFARLYASVLAPETRSVARVDLRYANGFAVEFAAAPAEQGAPSAKPQSELSKGDLANAKKV